MRGKQQRRPAGKRQPKVSAKRSRLRVLIFCGFTKEHRKIVDALAFALLYCDCEIEIAPLRPGHGMLRMEYIHKQIRECDLIVCDLTPAQAPEGWTYLNTSLELGAALFARVEDCLIFAESERQMRAQASNLLGYDIVEHGGDCVRLVREIVMILGLNRLIGIKKLPNVGKAVYEYNNFLSPFEEYCRQFGLQSDDNMAHRLRLLEIWMASNIPSDLEFPPDRPIGQN